MPARGPRRRPEASDPCRRGPRLPRRHRPAPHGPGAGEGDWPRRAVSRSLSLRQKRTQQGGAGGSAPRFSRAPPWSLPRPLSRRTPEHNHSHRVGLLRGPGLSAQPVRVRAKPGTRRHTCTHTRTRAAGQTVCVHPAGRLARRAVTRRRGPPVGDRRGRRASRTACAPGAHAPHAAPSAVI